jgi:hypothetical protein
MHVLNLQHLGIFNQIVIEMNVDKQKAFKLYQVKKKVANQ